MKEYASLKEAAFLSAAMVVAGEAGYLLGGSINKGLNIDSYAASFLIEQGLQAVGIYAGYTAAFRSIKANKRINRTEKHETHP